MNWKHLLFVLLSTCTVLSTESCSNDSKETEQIIEVPEISLDTLRIQRKDVYDARDFIAVQEYITNGIPRGETVEVKVDFGTKQNSYLSKMDFIVSSHDECLTIKQKDPITFDFLVKEGCHTELVDNAELVYYSLSVVPKENVLVEFEGLNGLEVARELDTLELVGLYYEIRN